MQRVDTIGILLAGGQSSRFGFPKAFAQDQDGTYFYERVYEALAAVSGHVVIVTREEQKHRFPNNVHVVTDAPLFRGDGPLAGIYTAMVEEPAERYVVLPCDMPHIQANVLSALLDAAAANATDRTADRGIPGQAAPGASKVYAVQYEGKKHPLVSCWKRSMLSPLYHALERGERGVIRLLHGAGVTWLDGAKLASEPHRVFLNVNRPEELLS